MKKTENKRQRYLVGLIIVLAVIAVAFVGRILFAPDIHLQELASPSVEPVAMRSVVLYFGDAQGGHLVAEEREIPDCKEEIDCIRGTIQALLDGPLKGEIPIFPKRVTLKGVREGGGVAVVDFSRELLTDHPGGSVSELMTVYGLVNTIAENFPFVRGVRIVVEGQDVETLKGHIDLREVVNPDFSFSSTSRRGGGVSNEAKIDLKTPEAMER